MSSVTRMMHLWPFTVDFQESWKRTMFGCCRPFSISTSSLKRCRSALVSLRVWSGENHTVFNTSSLVISVQFMMDYVSVVYVSACDREHFGLFCPEQSIPTDVSIPMTFSVNTKACYWLLGAVSHDMAEMCWFKSCTVSCTAASLCWLTLFWHTNNSQQE